MAEEAKITLSSHIEDQPLEPPNFKSKTVNIEVPKDLINIKLRSSKDVFKLNIPVRHSQKYINIPKFKFDNNA